MPLERVLPDTYKSRRERDVSSSASTGDEDNTAPELSEALATCSQVKAIFDVPLVEKHDARRARASRETRLAEAMSSRGGASIEIVGIGNAARVSETKTACERAPRKSETVRTKSNECPPSSSSARSKGEATLPSESKRAWIA